MQRKNTNSGNRSSVLERAFRWAALLVVFGGVHAMTTRAVVARSELRRDSWRTPARVKQFGPRAVGGSWNAGVADRLDALADHTHRVESWREQRRPGEPWYSRVPAREPAIVAGSPADGRRR